VADFETYAFAACDERGLNPLLRTALRLVKMKAVVVVPRTVLAAVIRVLRPFASIAQGLLPSTLSW
jgi:hypothetical protein